MRRYLSSETVSIGDNRLQLFQRVLRSLRVIALGKHATGSAYLDEIGTILDIFPHLMLNGSNAVGHTVADRVIFHGEKIVVAMSAGDSQRRPADEHAGPGNFAGIDGVATGHIRQ